MRLVTFNILHGRSPRDGMVDPQRLADAIRELQPDVLALQEVDRNQQRSGGVDLTAVAAEAMGAVDSHFAAAITGTPGGVWAASTGVEHPEAAGYGVALLSRFAACGWELTRLPRLRARVPLRSSITRRWFLARDEPRVALAGQLQTPSGMLTVGVTHLSFIPCWNVGQLHRALRSLASLPGPHLLMGDLNMSRRSACRASGWRDLVAEPTFPAWQPTLQLDHVLTDELSWSAQARVMEFSLSDHRAVVIDV